jgi:hypothetical protein
VCLKNNQEYEDGVDAFEDLPGKVSQPHAATSITEIAVPPSQARVISNGDIGDVPTRLGLSLPERLALQALTSPHRPPG